jgi:hypothetical protein
MDLARMMADNRLNRIVPAGWLAEGNKIVFAGWRGDTINIWRAAVNETAGTIEGRAEQLTSGTGEFPGQPSLDGSVPFGTGVSTAGLYQISFDPLRGTSTGDLKRVVPAASEPVYPTVTADGTKVVFSSNRLGTSDIWLFDTVAGKESVLVSTPEEEPRGVISPAGNQIAFHRGVRPNLVAYLFSLPAGPEMRLCDDCRNLLAWTPDSKGVIINDRTPERMLVHDIATGARKVLMEHPKYAIHDGFLSPDQQWLVFKVILSATRQPLRIARVGREQPAEENEWIKITGDDELIYKPFWSPDGNLVYFYSMKDGTTCLYARRLKQGSKEPAGEAFAVRHFHDRLQMPGSGQFTGYGFAKDSVYVPLIDYKSNVWIAEPQR